MKRYILIALAIISALTVITSPIVFGAMLELFLLGMIPGTDIVIPFWVVLPGSLLLSLAAIQWLRMQPLYIGSIPDQERVARQLARKRIVPKKIKEATSPEASLKRLFRPAKI